MKPATTTIQFREDAPDHQITEREFRSRYSPGSESLERLTETLGTVNQGMVLQEFLTADSYKSVVPEFFLSDFLGQVAKKANRARIICPSTRPVPRTDFSWRQTLGPSGDWGVVVPGTPPKQSTQRYLKRKSELVKRGYAASFERELLRDSPLSEMADRQFWAAVNLIEVEESWLTAEFRDKTGSAKAEGENGNSTDYQTLYDNTYQCFGVRTSKTIKGGATALTDAGIGVEDVLRGITKMRRSNDKQPTQLGWRGDDFYRPDYLVVSADTYRDLVIELFRQGFASTTTAMASTAAAESVRNTAMLEDFFGVRVVRMTPKEYGQHGDAEFITDSTAPGYLVDSRWIAWFEHGEGFFSQQWIQEARETVHIQVTKQEAPIVLDPLGLMRLIPA